MYANGRGVSEDFVFAYFWWNQSASQGNENAKKNKGLVSEHMTKEQIAEAKKLSLESLAKNSKKKK
jgi:TPR repeat protein